MEDIMTRTLVTFGVIAAAALLATACFPLEFADEEFTNALPEKEDLVVRIGHDDADEISPSGLMDIHGQLDPFVADECSDDLCVDDEGTEEWYVDGEIYQMTRDAKWNVNGGLVDIMVWVWAIVTSPNPEATSTGYMWGPWQESLSRIEFRFRMDKVSSGNFTFQLEGKNINDASDDWTTVVDGAIVAGDYPHASAGTVILDYDVIHQIDVSHPTPDTGRISYEFDVRDYPYTVEATFENFEPAAGDVINATYSYIREDAGMAGNLSFLAIADIWPEGDPDGLEETLTVFSEWTSSGQGRGGAEVSGGSLAADGSVIDEVSLDECWAGSDCLFYSTYSASVVDYNDGTGSVTHPGCGDILTCPVF